MLIEEEEGKVTSELTPEVFEAVFIETDTTEEEEVTIYGDDEESDAVDLAFVEDEGHW